MPVEAWEKRFLVPEGATRARAVLLIRRLAGEPSSWHSMNRNGDFAQVDLRRWRVVRTEVEDDMPTDDIPEPNEEEKAAILARLDDYLAGRLALPRPAAYGNPQARRGALAGRDGYRRRRRWYGRLREAGPARVGGGAAVMGGAFWKMYKTWGVFIVAFQAKFRRAEDLYLV